jgi:hypothetical protein
VPTKRTKRAARHHRITPAIISDLADGVTGVELRTILQLRANETMTAIVPPIARAALAAGPERLEAYLGRRLRDGDLQRLQRWAGEDRRPPPKMHDIEPA